MFMIDHKDLSLEPGAWMEPVKVPYWMQFTVSNTYLACGTTGNKFNSLWGWRYCTLWIDFELWTAFTLSALQLWNWDLVGIP